MGNRMLAVVVASLALSLSVGASSAWGAASGPPGEVTTFHLSGDCSGMSIAAAPGRGVLIRSCGGPERAPRSTIENLRPSGARPVLAEIESRGGPILAGPHGEVWAAGIAGESTVTVDRIAADGSVQAFPVGTEDESTTVSVRGLAIGDERALWAATGAQEQLGNGFNSLGGELVRIGTDGAVAHFPVPEGIEPQGLTRGPEGDLWFTAAQRSYRLERSFGTGVGYVGRMTPAGEFDLFRIPGREINPEGIAIGPDGKLWFFEKGRNVVATIGTDGRFGRRYGLHFGGRLVGGIEESQGGLLFDARGDAWIPGFDGTVRLTPTGQQTFFREAPGEVAALGPEGDLWSIDSDEVARLVPGAPGIDAQKVRADRGRRALRVKLACGGSKIRCRGTLELTLRTPYSYRRRHPRRTKFPLGKVDYAVSAESSATATVKISDRARAVIDSFHPTYLTLGPTVLVRATVAGGPTLQRRVEVPSLVRPRNRRGRRTSRAPRGSPASHG